MAERRPARPTSARPRTPYRPPARAQYRRRRAAAGAVLALLLAVIVWRLLAGGGGSSPVRASSGAHTASAASARATATTRAAAPALPLAGIPVGRWTALPAAPTARSEVSAARVGDSAYVVGGFDATGRTSAVVQRLNLRTGRWDEVPSLPEALNHMSAVAYGGRLYVVGGYASAGDSSTDATRGFWSYDPASGRWTTMPPAPIARAAAGAAVLGHRLYVVGGRNDASPTLTSLAIFDFTTRRWGLGPSLHHGREHLAAVATPDAVWALGGRALGVGTFSDVERYIPGAAAWQTLGPMPAARAGFQAVLSGTGVIVVGGEDGTQTVGQVDRLDPRTGRWSVLAPLPVPRHGLGLVADGPLVFAIDGGPQAGLTMSRYVSRLRAGS